MHNVFRSACPSSVELRCLSRRTTVMLAPGERRESDSVVERVGGMSGGMQEEQKKSATQFLTSDAYERQEGERGEGRGPDSLGGGRNVG